MKTLNLHLVVDAPRVADCALSLRQRLEPDQWQTLAALAAEILTLREATTGQLVIVVPAGQAASAVAKAVRAPGVDTALEKALAAS